MIEIRNISKWYGAFQVLKDCTTRVSQGEVVVVCGPSGSDKSTLIKCVNGLEPFQAGEVLVNGVSVGDPHTNLPKLRAHIGMVFQNFELSVAAIRSACLVRMRPIMMTTFAALFGALPLALTSGPGFELRRPLGISIAGGLIVSQLLTLFSTPVVYLAIHRIEDALRRKSLSAGEPRRSGHRDETEATALKRVFTRLGQMLHCRGRR